ncbi:hypothetical protein [Bradyrhizobium neotropicale]|uniref:hypothetical protein n=1 Tax=Bradyrhizobium neotropicale TaxID=1497615 RepID=UPI001AD77833|nr:hypothetical protein [Bradyrhizobium neotropicale]MBO4226647.1 hypothetical protein [Bradyrhizobium neotropicale]
MPGKVKTHCKNGHAMEGDNVRIYGGYRKCRECQRLNRNRWAEANPEKYVAQQREKNRRWKKKHPEQIKEHKRESARRGRAAGRIRYGYTSNVINLVGQEALSAAFDAARQSGRASSVYAVVGESRWLSLRSFYPKVGAQMDKIIREARQRLRTEIIKPAAPSIIRVANLDLLDRINAVVPRGLSKDQRDDIISDMVEAVLSGHVKLNALAQNVGKFVRASFQMDHNKFGPLSLDMPAFQEGETPLIETISRGMWD